MDASLHYTSYFDLHNINYLVLIVLHLSNLLSFLSMMTMQCEISIFHSASGT
jgi:hypothetical protein